MEDKEFKLFASDDVDVTKNQTASILLVLNDINEELAFARVDKSWLTADALRIIREVATEKTGFNHDPHDETAQCLKALGDLADLQKPNLGLDEGGHLRGIEEAYWLAFW